MKRILNFNGGMCGCRRACCGLLCAVQARPRHQPHQRPEPTDRAKTGRYRLRRREARLRLCGTKAQTHRAHTKSWVGGRAQRPPLALGLWLSTSQPEQIKMNRKQQYISPPTPKNSRLGRRPLPTARLARASASATHRDVCVVSCVCVWRVICVICVSCVPRLVLFLGRVQEGCGELCTK